MKEGDDSTVSYQTLTLNASTVTAASLRFELKSKWVCGVGLESSLEMRESSIRHMFLSSYDNLSSVCSIIGEGRVVFEVFHRYKCYQHPHSWFDHANYLPCYN